MKKALSLLLALVLVIGLAACGGGTDTTTTTAAPADNGETTTTAAPDETTTSGGAKEKINLYAFTDEVPGMIQRYLDFHPEVAEKYELNATIIATTDGAYQPALDQALAGGGADAPDIYTAEAAFILKYSQGDASQFAMPYEDLGIDVAAKLEEADIAQYTVDIGTNPDGKLVGLGYQATGGAFIYRRSLAKEVWGTDDPAEISKKVGPGWETFFKAAEELAAKGISIVSGDGDVWHAVENSSEKGWVVDGKLNLDPKREMFLDISKDLKDNGWSNETTDWQDPWFADIRVKARNLYLVSSDLHGLSTMLWLETAAAKHLAKAHMVTGQLQNHL